MEVFGPLWKGYTEKMQSIWREMISPDDLVLIAGDISWASRLDEATADLEWIDAQPGTKLLIRGNHDYWWDSASKMKKALPPSIQFIANTAFHWRDVSIGGSRLWDTEEFHFNEYVEFQENPRARVKSKEDLLKEKEEDKKIFKRELERLRLSLMQMDPKARHKIAMTHYPPVNARMEPSVASQILEEFGIQICVFGHLHNLRTGVKLFGEARGIRYLLTSCDYLNFVPIKIL